MITTAKLRILVLMLILSNTVLVFSQNKEDSLLFKLASTKKDTEKIYLLIDLSKFYNNSGDISRAQGFAKQALILSNKLEYPLGKAKADILLSKIFNSFDAEIAQNYILESLDIAKTLRDSLLIADCYNMIGIISNEKQQYEESLEYYHKSLGIMQRANDTLSISKVYNNIGVVYGHILEDSMALVYFLKAAELNKKYKLYLWNTINYVNIGRLMFRMDSIDKAFEYYKLAEEMMFKYNYLLSIPWLCNNYSYSYFNMGEYEKAIFYADSSYNYSKHIKNNTTQITALSLLKDIYTKTGRVEKALDCANKLLMLKDTVHDKEKEDKIKLMELKFEYEKEQRIKDLKTRNKVLRLWLVIGGLFITVFLLYILLRLQQVKVRHAKLNREILALEKENLNKELDLKNRELTSKIISLINISEVIDDIIMKLTQSGLNFKKENQSLIQELVSGLRTYKKTDIWQEFEQTFITIHPEFYKKLQTDFPELTNKELRLCAFLKLNMSSKEISNIMHININSVETARTRLRKKLNLTGTDISLYTFIAKY